MIFQSFILDNLVSLCLKIINSVVVVGLYYGFLTTFSIGPSYLFLLRAQVMEKRTEKKVSATTGFITGQLMMFISIYYAPLHLALGRPHTITVIAVSYLFFHFFYNNDKYFVNYGYKNRTSIRYFTIQRIFFNNLIFQLLNLSSSMLGRLVNIYMFRCNNKLLFLTNIFVGWLIGHIFLSKWIGLILVRIQQPIRSNKYVIKYVMSNTYIMYYFRKTRSKMFIVLLFSISCYYSFRTLSVFTRQLPEIQERTEIDIEIDQNEIDQSNSEIDKEKEEEDLSTYSTYLFSEKEKNSYKIDETEDKKIFEFEKPLVSTLFDYKWQNRPLRYIINSRFSNIERTEISQFFFHTCQSDGKERISFTYPPSLSTFFEMIETKMSLFTIEKISYEELSNYWSSANEEKRKKLSNEFINRIAVLDKKALDKKFIPLDILEKRIKLCNDETKTKYLPKIYDPFLNVHYRGRIKKSFLPSIKNKTYAKNDIWINKIHDILLNIKSDYTEFEQKIDTFDRKSLLTQISSFLNLISKFSGKSVSSLNFEILYLSTEHKQDSTTIKRKLLFDAFDAIRTDLNDDKTIVNTKKCIGIKEIRKKIPRWTHKIFDELEQLLREREDDKILSRFFRYMLVFSGNLFYQNYDDTLDTPNTADQNKEQFYLKRYFELPDFRRDIIKGSIRALRRKTVTFKFFQASLNSPLFLDQFDIISLFDILEQPTKIFLIFKDWMRKLREFRILDYTEEKTKESEKKKKEEERKRDEKDEKRRMERRMQIAEAWDEFPHGHIIRGFILITHCILRKYIIFPSLIITKNIVRILLFQSPEWSEDFQDWKKERYMKCTYDGVPFSERAFDFPEEWLEEGIQIKIAFPFRLKPWHKSTLRSTEREKDPMKKMVKKEKDFYFLTIFGTEVELPFASVPRNRSPFLFLDPVFKELKKKMQKFKKKIQKWKKNRFLIRKVSKRTKWIIKSILFVKKKIFKEKEIYELSKSQKDSTINKNNPLIYEKEIYELSKSQNDSTINKNNPLIYESSIPIQSINWTNCSLTEKKIKDRNDKTKTILKQIEKEINIISSNKTTYDAKRLLQKNILQILQRRNIRLARKLYSFFQFFIKRLYRNIFLCIISTRRINILLESKKKIINKSIYNNEANTEITDKTNQSIIYSISTIKKISTIKNSTYNIRNTNSQNSCDVSCLSQAYVFYKLSQIQVFNIYKSKLKSIFEYPRRSFFLKNEIKDYFFGIQGIFHSKLRHKNPHNSVMNQWTNWLKGHSKYDLSERRWSRLVPQKWRNKINEHCIAQNKDLTKCDSYEKPRLILYKKEKVDSLKLKNKLKKQYGYGLLSYKSIYFADKKDSYIYVYRSPFQTNKKKAISYNYNRHKQKVVDITRDISIKNYLVEDDFLDMKKNLNRNFLDRKFFESKILIQADKKKAISYNYNMHKQKISYNYNMHKQKAADITGDISIKNYLVEDDFLDMEKNLNKSFLDRKFFEWTILTFYIRNKVDFEAWIDTDSDYSFRIHKEINSSNQNKTFFDWMGMNVEIPNRSISKLEFWFFSKFVKFYNAYTSNPWIIPIKLLFFNKNISGRVDLESYLSNKYIEEDYAGSDRKKGMSIEEIKKYQKEIANNIALELPFWLRNYLVLQLNLHHDSLNQRLMNYIDVYSMLIRLRMRNVKEIAIGSIQRGELSLDIMMIENHKHLTLLSNKAMLIIEPVFLSRKNKNDEQFIMYQTLVLSLLHKNTHQIDEIYRTNQREREKSDVDKKNFSKYITRKRTRLQKMIEINQKNHYDLLVAENILSTRRRRELRIRICFNPRNTNSVHRNTASYNENKVNNYCQVLAKNIKDLNRNRQILINLINLKFFLRIDYLFENLACMNRFNLKFFLWPNYRLEDLACMNRYWFNTNNGSRFSILRIHMYPRLKIR
uniref:photosystem I assembly protein Ycf1 n=1 Tax=Pterodon emarginatus TaxID=1079077 RepID=UPI00233F6383|nr:photosystem I assembly protein Ycf1 [Pterodon emarginatus]WBR37393.1 photosystem I assembly protein Ycf1 [Pterodon emarginatus]